jgi:uncharacterized membrane protein
MSTRLRVEVSVLALIGVWLLATTHGPFSADRINDLYVYSVYHDAMHSGLMPFRDFDFEYPPGALLPIYLVGGSKVALSLAMLGCAVACQLVAWSIAGEAAGWLMVALPVLAGALVRTHFDLFSTALALGGLLLVLRRQPEWGLAVLGLGTMTKLWPAAIAVLAVAWLAGRGAERAAVRASAAFVAVLAVVSVPFAVAGGFPGVMVRFHLHRPVQIESTVASVLELVGGSAVTGAPIRPDAYKSNGLEGGAANLVLTLSLVALVLTTVAFLMLALRRHGERDLVLGAFGVTLAFVVFGKVFSPQYLCWLLPLAMLAWAQGERVASALTAIAALLTQVWFPTRYSDLVDQQGGIWQVVAVRNALLLLALAATARALARSPRHAAAWPPRG